MTILSDWCAAFDCEGDDEEDEEEDGDPGPPDPGEPADPTDDPDWLRNLARRLKRWADVIEQLKEWAERLAADHCDPEDLGTPQQGQLIILPGIDGLPTVDVENTFQWNWDGTAATVTVSDGTIEPYDPITLAIGVTIEVEVWAVLSEGRETRRCDGFIDAVFGRPAGEPVESARTRVPAGVTSFRMLLPVDSTLRVHGLVVRVRFPDFLHAGRITYTVTAA